MVDPIRRHPRTLAVVAFVAAGAAAFGVELLEHPDATEGSPWLEVAEVVPILLVCLAVVLLLRRTLRERA